MTLPLGLGGLAAQTCVVMNDPTRRSETIFLKSTNSIDPETVISKVQERIRMKLNE